MLHFGYMGRFSHSAGGASGGGSGTGRDGEEGGAGSQHEVITSLHESAVVFQ